MPLHIDVPGASGAPYRFTLAENARPTNAVAGVFLYVSQKPGEPPHLIHIGQANSLMVDAVIRWPDAVKEFGATELYTRLNVARSAREAEMADLMAAYDPPMK
jgi:hypothetical protein